MSGKNEANRNRPKWYVGAPRYGKTTLGVSHLWDSVERNGNPAVIIDSVRDQIFRDVPHVETMPEVFRYLYEKRTHVAIQPSNQSTVEQICRGVLAVGHANVFIDESPFWLNNLRMMRSLAERDNRGPIEMFLTAQSFSSDIPSAARDCNPLIHVFRVTAPNSLDYLERRYKMNREEVENLPVGKYLTLGA